MWAKNIDLDYDRTEYRTEISIPKRHLENVIRWIDYSENRKEYEPLNMFEGKEDWFIYLGKIPREWIKRYIKISKCKRYNSPETAQLRTDNLTKPVKLVT